VNFTQVAARVVSLIKPLLLCCCAVQELTKSMAMFGYDILQALVNDIAPDARVSLVPLHPTAGCDFKAFLSLHVQCQWQWFSYRRSEAFCPPLATRECTRASLHHTRICIYGGSRP
jgi:hypothetical protein